MKLRALRPLHGDYGTVSPGQEFEVGEDIGLTLESRGLAEYVYERKATAPPENKMIAPEENKIGRKAK